MDRYKCATNRKLVLNMQHKCKLDYQTNGKNFTPTFVHVPDFILFYYVC